MPVKRILKRLKKRFVKWLLSDLDELRIGKNTVTVTGDYIDFSPLTADPTLSAGRVWFRSDLGRLIYSPDGTSTIQLHPLKLSYLEIDTDKDWGGYGISNILFKDNVIPDDDNTRDIGTSSYAWRRIFAYYHRFVPTTAPTTPFEGDLYYDLNEKTLKLYNGTEWVYLGMPIEVVSEGTHTPSALNTEETVFETTEKGKYCGYVSVKNLADGDTVEMKLYLILKSGGSYELYDTVTLSNAQTETVVPIYETPIVYGFKLTLNQTAGTIRSYDYIILRVQK